MCLCVCMFCSYFLLLLLDVDVVERESQMTSSLHTGPFHLEQHSHLLLLVLRSSSQTFVLFFSPVAFTLPPSCAFYAFFFIWRRPYAPLRCSVGLCKYTVMTVMVVVPVLVDLGSTKPTTELKKAL